MTPSTRRRSFLRVRGITGLRLPPVSSDDSDDSQGIAAEVWTYIRSVERAGLEGSDELEVSSDEENSSDSSEEESGGDGDDEGDGGDGGDGSDDEGKGDGGNGSEGDGNGENVMNPTTIVDLGENAYMEMETTQIKGIDSTYRDTQAHLSDGATLIIKEKIMTHGHQHAETNFSVDLDGYDSSTNVISRSVAKDHSSQMFNSNIRGNNKCAGHSECDAIIMDSGTVGARPEITANSVEASLIHEAAIGKIAGEQLNKLMTLGLTEKEAEEQIISGFLK